jgi:sugar lactone lactonase YvrE
MRALRAVILIAALALLAASASAEPKAGPGYRLETFSTPGGIFAGLSRDGDQLLVTDLATGRLYRRGPNGKFTAFGPAFPHGLDVIGDPTGPYRVLRAGSIHVVAQGWTPVDSDEGPYDHALVSIDGSGGARVISNDFLNPFDFIVAGRTYYVIDAARNSVERVEADGTGRKTLFTFHRISQAATALQNLSPTEFPKESAYEVDAVPTGIAHRDKRIYVSLFGGFPFLEGAGKVVSIPENDGAPALRLEFEGLNAPVDITFDSDGEMLVLEHGTYDQKEGFQKGSGRLLRFDKATGRRETILDGLTRPVSVLDWDGRQLVVSELGGNLHFLTRASAD